MNTLSHITVKVVKSLPDEPDGLSGNTNAILHEILARLKILMTTGQTGAIDLRSLPLTVSDHELLRVTLGDGEVHAHVDVIGDTKVRETIYPGVWWLTYYDEKGSVVADLLEITAIPEILKAPAEDIREGVVRLNDLLGNR